MNIKKQRRLTSLLAKVKKILPTNWSVEQILEYLQKEYNESVTLSMLLLNDSEMRKRYIMDNQIMNGPDPLPVMRQLKSYIEEYLRTNRPVEAQKDFVDLCMFDMEFSGGIVGCKLSNDQNQKRFIRALSKMFGKWDGVVADMTLRYLYRRINQVITDEVAMRAELNQLVPANLALSLS